MRCASWLHVRPEAFCCRTVQRLFASGSKRGVTAVMAQNLLQCEVLGDDPMDAVSASSQDGICGIARSSTVKTFEKALSTVANEVSLSKAIRIVVGGRPKELDSYVDGEICLVDKEAWRTAR